MIMDVFKTRDKGGRGGGKIDLVGHLTEFI